MLVIGIPQESIINNRLMGLFKDRINILLEDSYKEDWPINYLEAIRKSELEYKITFINNSDSIKVCLDTLQIRYIILDTLNNIEKLFRNHFGDEEVTKVTNDVTDNIDAANLDKEESLKIYDKNNLTLDQLLNDDLQITEADIRELNATKNKLKVGLLLQAKSSLTRILKLSGVLDQLQDELVERITNSITTTDTPSLIYTTELISKMLNETNQFIVSVLSNEKIQNFFIIDNSVVNIGSDRVDTDRRHKVRKAIEIVLDNIDYFDKGDYDKMQLPNIIETHDEVINPE